VLPEFDSDGDLPPGIHRAGLTEIEDRFGKFIASDRRVKLYAKLRRLVEMAKFSGIARRIILGGSFVTAKLAPNDVDAVIVIAKDVELETLTQSQYLMADRDALRRVLKGNDFDVIIVREGTPRMQTIIEFFQSNRDNKPVGVVEVALYGNS
jgi:hypothetical protein